MGDRSLVLAITLAGMAGTKRTSGGVPVPMAEVRIFTIGHGARSIDELEELLAAHGIDCVIDVRAMPRSKRHPHFSRGHLEEALDRRGVAYVFEGIDLGGFRRERVNSRHIALGGDPFQGYADHMQSEAFAAAIERVIALGRVHDAAVMCAERSPKECHRKMIADALVARGVEVVHAIEPSRSELHVLNPLARIEGGNLIYDRGVSGLLAL